MKILVDIDNVLVHLTTAWVKYLNKMHDLNVDAEDIRDWEIAKFFPSLTKEEVMEPLTIESFWKTVDVDVKSLLYLRKLYDEGHEIYIVTATDYRNIKAKVDYILKPYFPFINLDHLIISHDKAMIKGDVLIDDYINNLLGGDYIGILLTASHNKHINVNDFANIYRAVDWLEVYEIIQKLEK